MASEVQYTNIDEVVRNLLISEGKDTEHDYMRYYQLGLNGLKELSFDVLQEVRTAKIEINPNTHSIELPLDFVNYTKIGLCQDGRVSWMAEDKTMCLPGSFDYEQADTPTLTESIETEVVNLYRQYNEDTNTFYANPYNFWSVFPGFEKFNTFFDGYMGAGIRNVNSGGTHGAKAAITVANGLSEDLISGNKYKISFVLKGLSGADNVLNNGVRINLINQNGFVAHIVDNEFPENHTQFSYEFIAEEGIATSYILLLTNMQTGEYVHISKLRVDRIDEDIIITESFDNPIPGATGSVSNLTNENINNDLTNDYNNSLGRKFGQGGGQNKNGYYRIDKENNSIYFSSDVTGDVIVEYISDGSTMIAKEKSKGANQIKTTDENGNTIVSTNPEDIGSINQREFRINVFAVEALMAYIYWQSIQRRRGINMNEKVLARREFYNQKRLAKSRLMSFTIEEALVAGRKGFKQSPKH
tara:strand:- start:11046 stop:12458 length:1413 start_codon:yes stop_codon:yes gene_type:complete